MSHLGAPAVHDFLKIFTIDSLKNKPTSIPKYDISTTFLKNPHCVSDIHILQESIVLCSFILSTLWTLIILKVIIAQQFSAMEREVREKRTDGRRKQRVSLERKKFRGKGKIISPKTILIKFLLLYVRDK